MKRLSLLPLLCLGAIPTALLPAAAPPAGPSPAEVARLIRQLGDDDYQTREAATRQLKAAPESALPALRRAAGNADPEVRRRARWIVASVERRLYGELLRLAGHKGAVNAVCFSPDGARLLTAGDDGILRLWDAHTGQHLRVFRGHAGSVTCAAISPDGKLALSGGADGAVRLWDAATARQVRLLGRHDRAVTGVVFGPEGKALSSGGGTASLWELRGGRRPTWHDERRFHHSGRIGWLAYSPKANLVATGGMIDQAVFLWRPETGKRVRKITGGRDYFNPHSVAFSPCGRRLLTAEGHTEATLRVWDVETGRELSRIDAPEPWCAAFSPDGKRVASAGRHDGAVRVWDVATGRQVRQYRGHPGKTVLGVAFSPDGRRLASAGIDGAARVWGVPR